MTRPGLVRADTIDLQNQDAPSTQDHSSHPLRAAELGKHQAAEIRHVIDERHSEEESLQEVWHRNSDDVELTDDQLQARQNSQSENGDSGDELDDDMLDDRISSSPSIDDGECPAALPKAQWPARSSSLTPTGQTLNRSATSTPDSSPFVLPPVHLPLSTVAAENSPASTQLSSSPFLHSPEHLPLSVSPLSKHHHSNGEYQLGGEYARDVDEAGNDDEDYYDHGLGSSENETYVDNHDMTLRDQMSGRPGGTSVEDLPIAAEREGPDEADIRHLLLPDNDPLLDNCFDLRFDSPSSWSTVSDASITSNPEKDDRTRDDDDAEDVSFYSDDRFVDSGWGGECLRETEDIDFDFVYALHTFVATVEGQANATKGDTMVLLDDSNSYWWLVRIVKDSSIGYLPAEHIETPTERLARLNKHRNVDLSAAMLGDSAEKSKNPLKKAMKRRNAKTVQFTAPTYVEASDYDYSSDEEDDMMPEPLYATNNGQAQAETDADDKAADSREQNHESDITLTMVDAPIRTDTPEATSPVKDVKAPIVEALASPTLVDKTEAAPLKSSRKGTPRNADSFLKDDGAETVKISLTPNLLRDDSNGGRSMDTMSSLESLEKSLSPPDRSKEEKKKKEKKPGMLSGLFKSKKKDKKSKPSVDEDSDMEKLSAELGRQAPAAESPKGSPKSPTIERSPQATFIEPKSKGTLQRQTSSPAIVAPIVSPSNAPSVAPKPAPVRRAQTLEPVSFVAELEGSRVDAPTSREVENWHAQSPQGTKAPGETLLGSTTLSSITNKIRPSDSQDNVKRTKVKKAKTRVELDDFDEASDEDDALEEQTPGSPDTGTNAFMHGTEMVHIPMTLGDDSSSPDENDTAEERGGESPDMTSSPSMVDTPKASLEGKREEEHEKRRDVYVQDVTDDDRTPVPSERQSAQVSSVPSPQTTTPPAHRAPSPSQRASSATPSNGSSARVSPSPVSGRSPASTAGNPASWSDANLRAWLDGTENDVRDMLVIIHDKSSVVPVGRDHPLMANLFVDESRKLSGLQGELDNMLGGWLSRKKGLRRAVAS